MLIRSVVRKEAATAVSEFAQFALEHVTMTTEHGVGRVQLYKQGPETQGMVHKAKAAISDELPKAETQKSDAGELDKKDFENAAQKAKESVDSMRAQAADAASYLQQHLTPTSNDDPEVKDFKASAAEVTGQAKAAVSPSTASNSSKDTTKQVSDTVYDAAMSVKDTVVNAASALSNKLSPAAQAMEKERDCAPVERKLAKSVDEAEKATVDAAEYVKQRLGERSMQDRSADIVRGNVDSATERLKGAEARAKGQGRVVEGAKYVKDRFVAPVSGDRATDRDLSAEAKRTAESAKDKTAATVEDTKATAAGTAEAAKQKTQETTESLGRRVSETAEEAKQRAQQTGRSISERTRETVDEAKHWLSGTYDQAKHKTQETADSVRGNTLDPRADERREAYEHSARRLGLTDDKPSDKARKTAAELEADAKQTAHNAQAKGENVLTEVESAAARARDKTLETARYIKDRFTAPATGSEAEDRRIKESARDKTHETVDAAADKTHRAVDKTAETARDTKRAAEDTAERAKRATEDTAARAKGTAEETTESMADAAKHAGERVMDSARYLKDRFTAPVSGSHTKDEEVKDRAAHAADRAGDRASEEAGQLKDTLLSPLRYVKDRFTAPVAGGRGAEHTSAPSDTDLAQAAGTREGHTVETAGKQAQEARDAARDRAERARDAAHAKADEAKRAVLDTKELAKAEGSNFAEEVKRSFRGGVSGDEHLDREEVVNQDTNARENHGGFLSSFLPPRDHAAEARAEAAKHEQESVFEQLKETLEEGRNKVADGINQMENKVKETTERWEEEVTPKTPEEALISEGIIPMNTEEVLARKAHGEKL